jgi:hypothetical protein
MRRTTLNFIVDAVALLDLLLMTATGILLKTVLPPGSGGGHGGGEARTLLGLGRHDWGSIHFILSLIFIALIVTHLLLHWRWIVTCAVSIFRPSRAGGDGPGDRPQDR